MSWVRLSNDVHSLPDAIEVWKGVDENAPLRAWLVRVDLESSAIDVEILSSRDSDGRQSAYDFATESGACIVVNGGYFKVENDLYTHIGLLIADGKFIHNATPGIFHDDLRYDVFRAAIGFDYDNTPLLGWVSSRKDSVFLWSDPVPNRQGSPGPLPDTMESLWNVKNALAAGPLILQDGRHRITVDEEVFFGTTIPDTHPRTAVGIDENGNLMLMVVDGRQRISRGVSLAELSALMKATGAVDAINLDGGGSSTMLVRNQLMNQPTGGVFQREIVSAIGIHCLND